jgi:hypothetical protein
MCQWVLTTILTLKRGYFENAVTEELDLVLSIGEERAHDISVGSGHGSIGVVAGSQS